MIQARIADSRRAGASCPAFFPRIPYPSAVLNSGALMKVCVFGAGAIGGHVATRLISAKAADVSVITRGRQLEAIRARGLTLLTGGREVTGRPAAATDDPSALPPQDV